MCACDKHISGHFLHRVNSRGLSSPVKLAWIIKKKQNEMRILEKDVEKCYKNITVCEDNN